MKTSKPLNLFCTICFFSLCFIACSNKGVYFLDLHKNQFVRSGRNIEPELLKIKKESFKHINLKIYQIDKELNLPNDSLIFKEIVIKIILSKSPKNKITGIQIDNLLSPTKHKVGFNQDFFFLQGMYSMNNRDYEFSASVYYLISKNSIVFTNHRMYQRD